MSCLDLGENYLPRDPIVLLAMLSQPKKLKQLNLDITRLYHLPKGVFLHLKYLEKLVLYDTSEEVLNANSCIVLTWLPACSKIRSFSNNNSEKAFAGINLIQLIISSTKRCFPTSQIFGKTGVIWKQNNRMGKWIWNIWQHDISENTRSKCKPYNFLVLFPLILVVVHIYMEHSTVLH
jgi:hypothetical protein